MTSEDWLYRIFASRHRWISIPATLVVTVAVAVAGGYLLAEVGPLYAAAGTVALVVALWMLREIEFA